MNLLTGNVKVEVETITTVEIAEMMEVEHKEILKKLEGTTKPDGSAKQIGIIPVLTKGNFPLSDYFILSSYKDSSGKENKCYLVTKLGCDFLANKFTGEKGIIFTAKYVKRFRDMEEHITKQYNSLDNNIIQQGICIVKFIADDLNVNDASRLLMYENYCKDVGVPTGFLPKYEHNDSKQMKSLTALLEENNCPIKAVAFNKKLIEKGYLEERERKSSNGGTKKFKALTEKGLKYGENAVSPHNQREVQPLYYSDLFMEMYNLVG